MRPQIDLLEEMNASNTRIQDLAQKDKLTVEDTLGRPGGHQRDDLESEACASASEVRLDREQGRGELTLRCIGARSGGRGRGRPAGRPRHDEPGQAHPPGRRGYQRRRLPPDSTRNLRLGSEQVALSRLQKDRQAVAADFRSVLGMESYVA